jgi:hypothetical protein
MKNHNFLPAMDNALVKINSLFFLIEGYGGISAREKTIPFFHVQTLQGCFYHASEMEKKKKKHDNIYLYF